MNTTQTRPILVCYDGSDGARRAIETAGSLFGGRKAIVLNVWSPISVMVAAYGGMAALPSYDDDVLQDGATKVATAGSALASDYEGTWHTILDVANQYDADLIVMGARGLGAFKSALLGSVSHSVTQHAHLPVLIVPPVAQSETAPEPAEHAAATA